MRGEEDILTGGEGPETNQHDNEDLSNTFEDQTAEGDFGRLQRDFYQQYSENKELSQYV